jgi:hypothetical protein
MRAGWAAVVLRVSLAAACVSRPPSIEPTAPSVERDWNYDVDGFP